MGLRLWNAVILVALGGLWVASGTQRERALLAAPPAPTAYGPSVPALEADLARDPADGTKVRALAQAYLDARAPGLALAVLGRAPSAVREQPRTEHLLARVLLDEGRADAALAAERRVLRTCTLEDGVCDSWLLASAMRRADILQALVDLGVEDAQADPEISAVAYQRATREARLAVR